MAKGFGLIQKGKIVFFSPDDYVAFGEKYLPFDIIQDALSFSWDVQHDPVPERYRAWGVRGLDELLWNPVSSKWLSLAARSAFYQKLLVGHDTSDMFTILAKSLALVVQKRFSALDDDEEATE